MDFQLTEEQREFRHFVHEFVAQEVKPLARHTVVSRIMCTPIMPFLSEVSVL